MSHLEFFWPQAAIFLLMLLPLWWKSRKNLQSALYSPMVPLLSSIIPKTKKPRNILSLPLLYWCLMVLALMRPQLVGNPIKIVRDGRSIMMVLDISESMETADMVVDQKTIDRLRVAKAVMSDFIDQRTSDRIGLVVFGSKPFLHAPLSFDHPTIKQFLLEAQSGFLGPKTAIGDALGLAVKKLLEETEGDRVIVMLTDGQNNEGSLEPLKAAEIAKQSGIKIYIAGLGAKSVRVNGFFGPTSINPSQSLDEAEPELKQMATLTGGQYYRAEDAASLQDIYQEIDRLEPTKSDPLVVIPRKELFYWPLLLMVLIMLLRALFLSKKGTLWT